MGEFSCEDIFDDNGRIYIIPILNKNTGKIINFVKNKSSYFKNKFELKPKYEVCYNLLKVVEGEIRRNPALIRCGGLYEENFCYNQRFNFYKTIGLIDGKNSVEFSSNIPSFIYFLYLEKIILNNYHNSSSLNKLFSNFPDFFPYSKEIFLKNNLYGRNKFLFAFYEKNDKIYQQNIEDFVEKEETEILLKFINNIIEKGFLSEKFIKYFRNSICRVGKKSNSISLFKSFLTLCKEKIENYLTNPVYFLNEYENILKIQYICANYFTGFALKNYTFDEILQIILIVYNANIINVGPVKIGCSYVYPYNIFLLSNLTDQEKYLIKAVIKKIYNIEGSFFETYNFNCEIVKSEIFTINYESRIFTNYPKFEALRIKKMNKIIKYNKKMNEKIENKIENIKNSYSPKSQITKITMI